MRTWDLFILIQCIPTLFLTGMGWGRQLTYDPLLFSVDPCKFPDLLKTMQKKAGGFFLLFMAIECLLSLLTLLIAPCGICRVFSLVLLLLVLFIWITMFCVQIPCHLVLLKEFQENKLRTWILAGWLRTIGWTVRSALLVWLVFRYFLRAFT